MAKKPVTKKVISAESEAPQNVPTQEVVTPTPVEEKKVVAEQPKPAEKVVKHYRFITTVSNMNIGNVIFDRIQAVVYEVNATSKDEAINAFKSKILNRFNGDMQAAVLYINSVFGGMDNVLIEEYVKSSVSRSIVTL